MNWLLPSAIETDSTSYLGITLKPGARIIASAA
jgi:hypothetical protein